MHVLLRILISVVAGVLGGITATGVVMLVYWVTGMDPGIGGGLIAVLAAAAAMPLCSGFVFLRLSRHRNDRHQFGSEDTP